MDGFIPKRVLVPVDFTDTSTVALATARRFASGYGAEILALFADTFVPPIAYADVPVRWYDENLGWMKNAASTRLVAYLQEHVGDAVRCEARVVTDTPVHTILRTVKEWNADAVVMGTHEWTGWRRAVLGSVAESVLHEIDAPIITVRHRTEAPAQNHDRVKHLLCPASTLDDDRSEASLGRIGRCIHKEVPTHPYFSKSMLNPMQVNHEST